MISLGFGLLFTLGALAVAGFWIGGVLVIRRVTDLRKLSPPEPAAWPKLSVIIPACNEGDTIEAALVTLLADDYPNLEIVLIDDRSADGTGAAIDRLAARDPRIKPVHVEHLPAGWLGKVHALHRGSQEASGDWLLFADADVHYKRSVLRKSVAYSESQGLDHFTLLPDIKVEEAVLDAMISFFSNVMMLVARPDLIGLPGSERCMGVGAFNLVRRAALARTEGFEWLKMEVADDFALALLIKRSGGKTNVAIGLEHLEIEWYRTAGEMVRGLEKNAFGVVSQYSFPKAVAILLGAGVAWVAPFAALIPLGAPFSWVAGSFSIAAWLGCGAWGMSFRGRPRYPVLLIPIAVALMGWTFFRSMVQCWRRQGIVWRGTLYPLAELRAGSRVEL